VTYLQRKMMLFVITLWAAITLNFALPRLMPGSPVDAALAKLASSGVPVTNAEVHAIQVQLGVPKHQPVQPVLQLPEEHRDPQLRHVLLLPHPDRRGDHRQGVAMDAGSWSGRAPSWAFVIGTLLGVYAGWRRGRSADAVVTLGLDALCRLPALLAGPAAALRPGIQLEHVPAQGWLQPGGDSEPEFCVLWRCLMAQRAPRADAGDHGVVGLGLRHAQQHDQHPRPRTM